MTKPKHLGEYIRQKRKVQGLTQLQLGRKLGYSNQFIYNWESGKALPPTKSLLRLIQILSLDRRTVMKLLLEREERIIREFIYGK